MDDLFMKLSAPFPPEEIEWRAQSFSEEKKRAMALAYITARAVMDRLDEVVGPGGWYDEYKPAPDGGILCGISIFFNGEWVTKWDGAGNTDIEAVKGGLSDSFKRAAVKWGIGRYLYKLDAPWVGAVKLGKFVKLTETPKLPAWALPEGKTGNGKVQDVPEVVETKAEVKADAPFAERLAAFGADKNGFLKLVMEEKKLNLTTANDKIKAALEGQKFDIADAEAIYERIVL